ncbi:hypothetical protein [Paraburkholderia youngii]|uniref:hypothetical protein n=1 Tax=Paraburkholderia youngii TaxID=2782701 RepID=UPI003D1D4436
MTDHVTKVGPNATLSRSGLTINDERNADAPKVEAWGEYAAAVLELQQDDLTGAQEAGKTLLRWCLAAYSVAHIQKHPVRDTENFMPVWYMLQSGRALATTPGQWIAYQVQRANWLADFAAGTERADPRPGAIAVAIPWPGKLGVDLGGPDQLFSNACSIASDILSSPRGHRLAVAGHAVECVRPDALIALFDEKAERHTKHAMLGLSYAGEQFRAQRITPLDGGEHHYVFRLLRQHHVPLSELTERMRSGGRILRVLDSKAFKHLVFFVALVWGGSLLLSTIGKQQPAIAGTLLAALFIAIRINRRKNRSGRR